MARKSTPKVIPEVNPVDQIIAEMATAMHQWQQDRLKDIKQQVYLRLDAHRDEVLRKLMGFNRSHDGRWEIDHCNGRGGESAISDWLKTSQKAAIDEWLKATELPQMTAKFKADTEKSLRSSYEGEIRTLSYSMGRAKAQKDMKDLMDKVFTTTLVDRHLQMQDLLTPKPTTETP